MLITVTDRAMDWDQEFSKNWEIAGPHTAFYLTYARAAIQEV